MMDYRRNLSVESMKNLIDLMDQDPDRRNSEDDKLLRTGVRCFNGLIGEEFLLACLTAYFQSRNGKQVVRVSHDNLGCTDKSAHDHHGHIDAWYQVGSVLYATEVKNWSARSLGGVFFEESATEPLSPSRRLRIWERQYLESLSDPKDVSLRKLFYEYAPPMFPGSSETHARCHFRRLLAVWDPVLPGRESREDGFWTDVQIHLPEKSEPVSLDIFSLSIFLRSLVRDDKSININAQAIINKLSLVSTVMNGLTVVSELEANPDANVLLVSISKSWDGRAESLWRSARGWWRCSEERAPVISTLVAIYKSKVAGIWNVRDPLRKVSIEGRNANVPADGVVFSTNNERVEVTQISVTVANSDAQRCTLVVGSQAPEACRLSSGFRYAHLESISPE